jgi:potassium efflux system protein
VISDLSCAILEKFTEQKIEIPFPQREIHIRSELRSEPSDLNSYSGVQLDDMQ